MQGGKNSFSSIGHSHGMGFATWDCHIFNLEHLFYSKFKKLNCIIKDIMGDFKNTSSSFLMASLGDSGVTMCAREAISH